MFPRGYLKSLISSTLYEWSDRVFGLGWGLRSRPPKERAAGDNSSAQTVSRDNQAHFYEITNIYLMYFTHNFGLDFNYCTMMQTAVIARLRLFLFVQEKYKFCADVNPILAGIAYNNKIFYRIICKRRDKN